MFSALILQPALPSPNTLATMHVVVPSWAGGYSKTWALLPSPVALCLVSHGHDAPRQGAHGQAGTLGETLPSACFTIPEVAISEVAPLCALLEWHQQGHASGFSAFLPRQTADSRDQTSPVLSLRTSGCYCRFKLFSFYFVNWHIYRSSSV